jgi:hypothetical protein
MGARCRGLAARIVVVGLEECRKQLGFPRARPTRDLPRTGGGLHGAIPKRSILVQKQTGLDRHPIDCFAYLDDALALEHAVHAMGLGRVLDHRSRKRKTGQLQKSLHPGAPYPVGPKIVAEATIEAYRGSR